MNQKPTDGRVLRTRQALLDAFIELVLTRSYDDITVQDVARRAGVGRSTLYEHFSGKRALLGASLAYPFGVLADTINAADNTDALVRLLDHFWENRTLARRVFTGQMRVLTVSVLVRTIEERLQRARPRITLGMPKRLLAVQLAEVLFAPVAEWLTGGPVCPAPRLARALRASAVALISAPRPAATTRGK
jgi:AcrR family transcriptional regulator